MRRRFTIALIILVPLLLFGNVLQAYRYNQLEDEISRLESEQLSLLEQNKRAILAISVLSSPDRIGPLAEDELGLVRPDQDEIIHMYTTSAGEDQ
jgi:cell division protein FtsL